MLRLGRHGPATPPPDSLRSDNWMEGTYSEGGQPGSILVRWLLGDVLYIDSPAGWESVGLLEGNTYRGLVRQKGVPGVGLLVVDWKRDGTAEAQWTASTSSAAVAKKWRRISPDEVRQEKPTPAPTDAPTSPDRPEFGQDVYVEEPPEAITKVSPIYPDEAREHKIEGEVLVQALVLKDGTVGDAKVVKSIPELNAAAVAAVRQWRFKPALTKGQPVAVWVAVPIKFALP